MLAFIVKTMSLQRIYISKFVNDITLDNHQVLTKSKQDEDINYYYGYNRTSSDEYLYHYDGQNIVTTLLDSQNKLIDNYTYNDYGHRELDYQAYISHNEFGYNGETLTLVDYSILVLNIMTLILKHLFNKIHIEETLVIQ